MTTRPVGENAFSSPKSQEEFRKHKTEILTPKDLAGHIGINVATVYNWIKDGVIVVDVYQPLSSTPGAKRSVPRYGIPADLFHDLDSTDGVTRNASDLRRYVPRLEAKKRRARSNGLNGHG